MYRVIILFFLGWVSSWGWVFISSDPLQADVFINDQKVGKTPYIITNEPPRFSLTLAKPGYTSIKTSVKISSRITNMNYTLSSESFHIQLPGHDTILINGQKFRADEIKNLAQGIYQFTVQSNTLSITKINPNKPFFYFSIGVTTTGLVTGALGLLMGSFEYEKFKTAQTYDKAVKSMQASMFYDNLALWGLGLAAVGGVATFYLDAENALFKKKANQFIVPKSGYYGQDKLLYEEALDFLAREKNDEVIQKFETLLSLYPESPLIPAALYQWGRILKQKKAYSDAYQIFLKILSTYPVIDFYEFTLYELFTLEIARKQFQKAESYLSMIKSVQFFYSVEDGDWFELDLYRAWSKEDPTKQSLYEQKKKKFIDTSSYSSERRLFLQKE
ncbi:PEGA domain-containing protein [Thermospira aquatica]|uniref:PEGA domain-containing protein n=1 Tax=Thermospira aquatica TaxID=2828656 RepID=A0AAX3BC31_9SPIR|nr:PEGA domain-containing protein [Thermospira aquatica]URA09701.1 PEGA domain-containing protein [Thermospira aquatica]